MARRKKVIELAKTKPRREEEKFFIKYSATQLNATLILILSATFLVQGVVKYLEVIGRIAVIGPWLTFVMSSLLFLVISVVSVSLDAIVFPLKIKRILNLIGFSTFILGFILFLTSIFGLLFVI